MNKNILYGLVGLVIIGVISFGVMESQKNSADDKAAMMKKEEAMAMEKKDAMVKEESMKEDSMDGKDMAKDKAMMEKDTAMMKKEGETMKQEMMMVKGEQYVDYSKASYDASAKSKRVLFFKASWCPTCNAADADFKASLSTLPKDVVVFKVDYDTEKELKAQYGIVSQHTYVYVDAVGKAVKKWNGGATAEVVSNTKS
jgi:thioredoxin 1